MKLIDLAKILRSKNAGPLFITFDLMFENREQMETALSGISAERVAEAYGTEVSEVSIIAYPVVNSFKITFPRRYISGSVYDTDVYGCQCHVPLGNIEIENQGANVKKGLQND